MSVPRSKSTDPFQTADTYTLCLLLPGTQSALPPFSLADSTGDQSAACPYSLLLFCRLRTMGAAFKDTETTNSFWEENHLSTLEFQNGKEDT